MRKLQWGPAGLCATTRGAAFTLGLVACGGQSDGEGFARVHHDLNAAEANPAALQTGVSCDELLGRLQSELLNQVSERAKQVRVSAAPYYGGGIFIDDVTPVLAAPPPLVVAAANARAKAPADVPPASAPGFSQTTVQTPGVDEADFVKADGDRIYVLQGRDLIVLNAASTDATEVLATIPLEGDGVGLFVHEGRVVVFSNFYGPLPGTEDPLSPFYYYYPSYTVQTVIDATSSGFDVLRETFFEAYYSNSRRDGNIVRSVLSQSSKAQLDYPNISYVDFFGHPRSQAEIDLQVDLWVLLSTESIEDSIIEDYLPASYERIGGELVQQPLHCEDYLTAEQTTTPAFTQFGTTSVIGLDLGAVQAPLASTTLLGYSDSVQLGKDSAVFRLTDYSDYTGEQPNVSSILHRFGFDGASTTYTASAEIAGSVLSLDEYNGVIRVASVEDAYTTDADAGGGLSYAGSRSRILTLGVAGGQLTELGRTPDTGLEYGIGSTQFFAERGYQLRYIESVASIAVVDLSNPAAPAIEGSMTVSGNPGLLYPLSSDVLFGLVENYDPVLGNQTLTLRLYDVQDASAPRVAQEYTFTEPSYSEAVYDPHALTFYPSRNLLAFPTQSNAGVSGLEVFRTSIAQGFTHLGRAVPPTPELSLLECLQLLGYPTDPEFLQQLADDPLLADQLLLQCSAYSAPYVRRGLLRDNDVYAVSTRSVAAYSLDALDGPPLSQATLPIGTPYYYFSNPLSAVPRSDE